MNQGKSTVCPGSRSLTKHRRDDGSVERRGVQGLHLRPHSGQSLGMRQQEAQQPKRSRTDVALENKRLTWAQQQQQQQQSSLPPITDINMSLFISAVHVSTGVTSQVCTQRCFGLDSVTTGTGTNGLLNKESSRKVRVLCQLAVMSGRAPIVSS